MIIPTVRPGLVLSYSYLWWDQARRGQEEGGKDRPAVVVLTTEDKGRGLVVTIAPITHLAPGEARFCVEMQADTKARLGLDASPSWIITNDLNRFTWPGYDLRPIRRGSDRCEFGILPTALLRRVRDGVLTAAREGRLRTTPR
ncbi:MAG TPA: type II toxin-antitoxin system PemK/MazF family toxin [Brevundimonas sp.]|nr:type II toxin-antitoxin system PemK/MazF family toxin [Brevundimonas sp.]